MPDAVTHDPAAPLEEWEVLDLLTSLVDKSLVLYEEDEQGVGRYRFLETVRQYADDRLLEGGESEALRDRHSDWFAAYAARTNALLTGVESAAGWDQAEIEYPNLRAAMEWCLEQGDLDAALRVAGMLYWFWNLRGRVSEGREVYARLLTLSKASQVTTATIGLMREAGHIANKQQDYVAARLLYEEALRLDQELGDQAGVALTLAHLGHVLLTQGDLASARSCLEHSLRLHQEINDTFEIAHLLLSLGHIARFEKNYEQAHFCYAEAIAKFYQVQPFVRLHLDHPFLNMGHVARLTGKFEAARRYYSDSLQLFVEAGNRPAIAACLEGFACLAASQGHADVEHADVRQAERAACLFGAAEAMRQAVEAPLAPSDRAALEDSLTVARAVLDDAFETARARGQAMTLEQAVEYALKETHD